jgi:S1-C subfamily serine protease
MIGDTLGAVRYPLAIAVVLGIVGAGAWLNRPRPPARSVPPAPPGRDLAVGPNTPEATPSDAAADPAAAPPAAPDERSEAPGAPPPAEALEDVVSRVVPAVVLVETPVGRGTAFFVATDTLLTNSHVVGQNDSVTIRRSGGAAAIARVLLSAPAFDVAVLRIFNADPNQATIPLGSALSARVGQDVIAIGSPLGTLQDTVTRGIVSAVRHTGTLMLVQTDAAINPGNSGGPLLDRAGVAIGIATMGYAGRQGLNFAIAIDHARAVLDGRTSAVSTVAGPSVDITALSPERPSIERARPDGGQLFDRSMARTAERADALERRWSSFKTVCYQGRIAGTLEREWLALLDPHAMSGVVAPGCAAAFAELQQAAQEIRDSVGASDEAARRADVYPGIRRDILRKYRLESLIR